MRNTRIVSITRLLAALTLATPLVVHADGLSSGTESASSLFDQLLSPPAPLRDALAEQRTLLQSINGYATSLLSTPARSANLSADNTNPLSSFHGNRQVGQWLANAAQYAGNLQISATTPLDANFLMQAPSETARAAINSKEVSQYLEKNSESASLLSQLLGWQRTGLLPSTADLQKMAADHVGAVTSSVERWALQNVSFSATSHAITSADTQEPMLQWQWSVSNSSQYNNNSVADNEANFSANLRRLFGMNDYY